MSKKNRPNELSEDELDCVTGGASQEEDAHMNMAKAVRLAPVATKASNKVLPKSLAGQAVAAKSNPEQMSQKAVSPGKGIRASNFSNKLKKKPGK